jgi:hypothetical protein
MAHARVAVCVDEDSVLREHPFVGETGDACAWLDIGDHAMAVWGTPAAMRRLATAVTATADAADRLAENDELDDQPVRAAA